ncbi:MAG: DUF1460 domain-containing protein [Ignavibacteria bacterium]|nr:DUF1460 domain-containing protein [Ignavibacteria bacterium]
MKKLFVLIFTILIITLNAQKPDIHESAFNVHLKAIIESKQEFKTSGEINGFVGRTFLGTPYVAHTLEQEGPEHLVLNFTELDCTTFLETCVAYTLTVKSKDKSLESYKSNLQKIRYRGGVINSYPSRLHYFSDWIFDNCKKGIAEDITRSIGGEPIVFPLDFMTTHPESYRQLKETAAFIDSMKRYEAAISKRTYFYIPKDKVGEVEKNILEGDLIAITTNVPGIDIAHVGLAVRDQQGKVHFMHAPITGSKVQITETTLADYLKKNKKHTGIIVLRLK